MIVGGIVVVFNSS